MPLSVYALHKPRYTRHRCNVTKNMVNYGISRRKKEIKKQESTGVSPFELMYGREARTSFHVEREEMDKQPIGGQAQYFNELKKRHNDLKEFVTSRTEKAQSKQKENYDKKFRADRSKHFEVGDIVFYKNFRARGLAQKFIGPCRVVSKIDNNCKIESLESRKRKFVHANSLKLFNPVDFVDEAVDIPEMESSSSDEETLVFSGQRCIEQQYEHREPRYQLRRNRRQPDRFGIPVYDY